MHPELSATTPEDFPDDTALGTVSGAISRQLVRKLNGKFVAGMTGEELYRRYEVCVDMVNQIEEYCHRKLTEKPDLDSAELLRKVHGILEARHDWDFSVEEQRWILRTFCGRMKWSEPT